MYYIRTLDCSTRNTIFVTRTDFESYTKNFTLLVRRSTPLNFLHIKKFLSSYYLKYPNFVKLWCKNISVTM
ncbi:hypothetical protein C1645_789401, partial [Glomus cerebriforme]